MSAKQSNDDEDGGLAQLRTRAQTLLADIKTAVSEDRRDGQAQIKSGKANARGR
jgi:hypothetical protein